MKTVLLLLLAALTASTQTQPAATVEGVVLRSGGRIPIAGARILLQRQSAGGNGEYDTMTESDGGFILRDIAPGRYRLHAKLSGFIDAEYGARRANSAGTPVDLGPGQTLRDVVIQMAAGAVISGRIYDQAGHSIPKALVQLFQSRYMPDGRFTGVMVSSAVTDDLGEYRIFWIAPGTYYLHATATNSDVFVYSNTVVNEQYKGIEDAFLPTYYPDSFDSAAAIPIQVDGGVEIRGLDIAMKRFPTVHLRGQVVDALTGQPAPNIDVWLRRKQDGWPSPAAMIGTTANATGEFDLRRVVPGVYTLGANPAQPAPGLKPVNSEIEIHIDDKDILDLRVLLLPIASLRGHVVLEGGTPPRPMSLNWDSVNGDTNYHGGAGLDDNGNFSQTLRPGKYRLSLSAAEGYFLRSARSGSRNVLRDGIETLGESPEPLEVTVAYSTAAVEGIVANERNYAATGVQVVLIPDTDRLMRPDLFRNVTTDQRGRFTIRGVAPGNYKIFAWEDIEAYTYFDPEFMELYESRGTAVHVEQSETVKVSMKSMP